MATYVILNLLFIIAVSLLLVTRFKKPSKAWVVTLVGLIVLTAIFDNLIIAMDIVGYDTSKILNLYIGIAPVEDFMYALLAAIMIPALWNKLGVRRAK